MRISDWSSDVCSSDLMRQALAAVFFFRGQAAPAGLAILLVGFLEVLRRGDHTVVPVAAFLVTALVERGGHLAHELAAFFQHRVDDVTAGIGEAELVAQLFHLDRKSTRRTPVTNAHLVCRLLLEKKKNKKSI